MPRGLRLTHAAGTLGVCLGLACSSTSTNEGASGGGGSAGAPGGVSACPGTSIGSASQSNAVSVGDVFAVGGYEVVVKEVAAPKYLIDVRCASSQVVLVPGTWQEDEFTLKFDFPKDGKRLELIDSAGTLTGVVTAL
ncbi:MAG: hypothetical protein HYZ29_29775 [Myxococcales bacterium]|nr:hypothetical protein [Myxococcales bacterium]